MLVFKKKHNNKHMKHKTPISLATWRRITAVVFLAIGAVVTIGLSGIPQVAADSVSNEIQRLQRENAANQSIVDRLQDEAGSYQDAINKLQGEINRVQASIDASVAEQTALQTKIDESQRELERQKSVLGENIRVMYVEGRISTIEMLATSKDLSDFVDKEEYRTTVKNKIQETLKQIAILQNQLKDQKTQVEKLLAQQQAQRNEVAAARNQQAKLLSYNKSQQADYNRKASANQARIDELIAQQRRANEGFKGGYYFIRFPGAAAENNPAVNDYPYANAGFSMSTLSGCGNPDPNTGERDSTDRWGYCTRQCVSYAAWAVERSGRTAPRNYGSANEWLNSAPASWVHRDPKPGDVAILNSGRWGHAMYVEKVEGDRIYVSQYNRSLDGRYSTQWREYR